DLVTIVGGGEGEGGRQGGQRVGAGEGDRAGVVGGLVAVAVPGDDGKVLGQPRGRRRGIPRDLQGAGRQRGDRVRRVLPSDGTLGRVGGDDLLAPGGIQRGAEGLGPRVG